MTFVKKLRQLGTLLLLGVVYSSGALAITPKEAGQKGVDYLTHHAVEWQTRSSRNQCFACHTQGMSIWGASIGEFRGYNINKDELSSILGGILRNQRSDDYWSSTNGSNRVFTTAIASSGLAFYDRYVSTLDQQAFLRGAEKLITHQQGAGHWASDVNWGGDAREILRMGNNSSTTAMAIVTMRRAFEVTQAPKFQNAYIKAAEWLSGVNPADTQSLGFKIIGLKEAQYSNLNPSILSTVEEILKRRNEDGGFGKSPGAPSSAFQTGIAVYGLRLAGLNSSDVAVSQGIQYLVDNQNEDGSWPIAPAILDAGDPVGPNMWAVIALGEFGEFGVEVTASPENREMQAFLEEAQTLTYQFTVTNTGSGDFAETYDIRLSGGAPGFPAAIDVNTATLAPGESQVVNLTIITPVNLPFGLPVTHSVSAMSRATNATSAIASVTSATPPPPPTSGHRTNIMFLEGANIPVSTNHDVRLAVSVVDSVDNVFVKGSADPTKSIGTVNFFVGGVNVGSDNDVDGNGIFEVEWLPGRDWNLLGLQSILVTYSGIDRPAPGADLLNSFTAAEIVVNAVPVTANVIAEEVYSDIDDVISLIPPASPDEIFIEFRQAQDEINDVNAALAQSDTVAAKAFFEEAIRKLQIPLSDIDNMRCSEGIADPCINDDLVDLIVTRTNIVIADISEGILLL